MSHLTPREEKIYTDIFKKVDVDNSGCLNLKEVGGLCTELGFNFDESQVKELFGQLDKDGSGTVGLDEFLSVMHPIKTSEKRCATLRRMFKTADVNKDGVLSADELHKALTTAAGEGLGELDKAAVEKLIKQADVNGDGLLDYEEFLALLKPIIEAAKS